MMKKKGQTGLNALYPAVLTIVLVGIILGVGIFVLTEVSEGVAVDSLTVVNETVVFTNNSGLSVATASDCGARDFAITSVWNASDRLIASPNYTFSTSGLLTAADGTEFEDCNANVSYTYTGTKRTGTTDPCSTLTTTGTGVGTLASWIAVIVVVLAAAIVLGIVIRSFGRRNSV